MDKNIIKKKLMGLAMSLSVAVTTLSAPVSVMAAEKGEYSSVNEYLSSEFTATDSVTDWTDEYQKNYKTADGSAESDYLVEGFEWTDIRKGEGKITVAGANTEPSVALYVFTTCFHGTASLSRQKVVAKDIAALANAYDRVDVIAIDGPDEWGNIGGNFEGVYGGMHDLKSFTALDASTAGSWVNSEIKRWSGAHFTGNVPAAIRKYMFGSVDGEISSDNLVHRPSAIYVSADMHYLTNATATNLQEEESRLAKYATPELFEYIAKYYRGETQRYFSSSQTGKNDNPKTALVKRRSFYDAEYMKVVAGVFNPELYTEGASMLSKWSGEAPDVETTDFPLSDGKFASDYNYKDDILSAGIRLPDKQIIVQKTVSDDFQIMRVKAVTQSGLNANVSVNGQTITATAESFISGDEISMEISVRLKPGLSKQFIEPENTGEGSRLLDGDISIMATDSTKFMPLVKDITINTTWNDDGNRDAIRLNDVDIALTSSEGSNYIYNMNGEDSVDVKGVLAYLSGKAVSYTASGESVDGYSCKVTTNKENSDFNVIYSHDPEKVSLQITKQWEDDNNRDGIRPGSVYVTLTGSDGNSYDAQLSSENGWKYVFSNLYSFNGGIKVKYTLSETEVEGYSSSITASEGGYTITNTHKASTKTIFVTYKWEDDDNRDGIRPDKVAVTLTGDDGNTYEAELTKSEGYRYVFSNLPVYKNGTAIKYSLKTESLSGYKQTIAVDGDDYYITGTHSISITEIKVLNEWTDDNNRDGLRPDSVEIILTGSDGKNYRKTVSAKDSEAVTFSNLPVYTAGGEKITYEVLLPEVDGYSSSFAKADRNHDYVINNAHTPETTSITVTKIWDDGNDADGMRKNATFVLTGSDGSKYEGIIKKDAKTPTYTFANLYVYANGDKITYTLDEKDTNGYESKFERTKDGYTVTNTHIPGEKDKSEDDEDDIVIDTPKTGDDNNIVLWLSLAGLLAIGGGGAGIYLDRKKGI